MGTKNLILVLLIAGSCVLVGMAPSDNHQTFGIYSSYQDFMDSRIRYPLDCDSSQDKLRINSFFASASGYIEYKGQKYPFNKSQVFGYRDCNGINYRFYGKESYKILEVSGITLYYKYGYESFRNGKGMVKTDQYFFSRNANGPIVALTIGQLRKAFPDNARFQSALDASFRTDNDLIAYDEFQKTHKLVYLYKQSLN